MFLRNKCVEAAIIAALSVGYGYATSLDVPIVREGARSAAVSPLTPELTATNEPASGTTAITIHGDELRQGSHIPSISKALSSELSDMRDTKVKNWAANLMDSQFNWYRAGNAAEAICQVCQALTVVLSGCAAGFKDSQTELALASMCTGTISMALGKFSKYAHGESAERGVAANEFLKGAGISAIPVIKDPAPSQEAS